MNIESKAYCIVLEKSIIIGYLLLFCGNLYSHAVEVSELSDYDKGIAQAWRLLENHLSTQIDFLEFLNKHRQVKFLINDEIMELPGLGETTSFLQALPKKAILFEDLRAAAYFLKDKLSIKYDE